LIHSLFLPSHYKFDCKYIYLITKRKRYDRQSWMYKDCSTTAVITKIIMNIFVTRAYSTNNYIILISKHDMNVL